MSDIAFTSCVFENERFISLPISQHKKENTATANCMNMFAVSSVSVEGLDYNGYEFNRPGMLSLFTCIHRLHMPCRKVPRC